ncbi:Major facilitator superfamily domain, general substrate transporter [Penicillium griseofulvum]|uniref:Major facilitator superfamily domain, general substrate transporter n=1 Tax=Penicillium patulum TaxID=5078 RepID=A0A135LWM2_PENPA|nr:Major facilitator superfamily domain, general substrate transporter [Penicillium griseofulvum]KXG53364.1 Major facilitator superfamily domain, general substrate transporter [Penicillium griseofulvum]
MANHDIEAVADSKSVHANAPSDTPTPGHMDEGELVILTNEDNIRIRRKTDKRILAILTWVYFLQILDKGVLGTASIFNLQEDTGLVGSQYSLVSSIAPIAQVAWQPFSAWLIVKVPPRILMPSMILCWGVAAASTAACHNFAGLVTVRFFLGLFEAGCMPLFTILTAQWYRRVEQPLRVSIWNSMNGTATMVASALSYGLGHIPPTVLKPWQTIFLVVGLVTIVTAPFIYWKLDNDITTARFLTEHERKQGVERLRANQTGSASYDFDWSQVIEVALDPKSWIWIIMALLPNMGSAMTSTFGPLIVKGFGFDAYETSLLNIPFGAMQTIVIISGCWASYKLRLKSAILIGFMIPVVAGIAVLYALPHEKSQQGPLLLAYYLCAFLFAANPLLLSWVVANTAGAAKTSVTMALYQAGTSAGALAGPLLFTAEQAPSYLPGIRAVLGLFIALVGLVVIQVLNLSWLNRLNKKRRISNGKIGDLQDKSMTHAFETDGKVVDEPRTADAAPFVDLTDRKNDEFVYVY